MAGDLGRMIFARVPLGKSAHDRNKIGVGRRRTRNVDRARDPMIRTFRGHNDFCWVRGASEGRTRASPSVLRRRQGYSIQ
ncbi:hypothetical protein [Bradyrhizobium sp. LA7.1]|uniref:hypothetical protein n=1 Tax=Bradyrhizobium sp. LA7.1 TaxID=3156324 RepID=UPI0033964106